MGEPGEGHNNANQNIEAQMLTGCFVFVWYSVGCLALTIWPFFVWLRSDRLVSLLSALALGLIPAALVGAYGSRRIGIPAGAGFVASAMATGIFQYIRLNEMFLGARAKRIPQPDYPETLVWLLPLCWTVLAFLVALATLKPGAIPSDGER